jgi:hypothetical protein
MTDIQMFTLAVAVLFPLSMLIFSNSRVTDAKESLGLRISDLKETLNTRLTETKQSTDEKMRDLHAVQMEALLRIDNKLDHVIETLANHSDRLTRLESK